MGGVSTHSSGVAVGVDPSANSTGVVILDASGKRLHHALILPQSTGLSRLVYIRAQLEELLRAHGPFKIGTRESYSLGSTNRPFLLGEVGGIVQLALYDHCERVEECAPKALKKFASSNASASKSTMIEAVKQRWGFDYDGQDDLADAHALAQLGLHLLDPSRTSLRDQREVMAKIVAPKKRKVSPFRLSRAVI